VDGGSPAVVKDVRTYTRATYAGTTHCTAYSQGNHNLSVADVDGDGMDEVIYGSAAIDHDGTLLWSTGLNHGDAIHVGDLMPDRPGLEVFQIHEDPPFGMHICDAATGQLLIHMTGDGDTARGIAADFTPERGYEFCYFGDGSLYNAPTGSIVGAACAQNFRIYWDGDVYDEILNDKGGGHNQPFLEKYNQGGLVVDGKRLFEHGYSVSCNGTKTTPCLQADIFGDWREELIFYNGDDKSTLNIFSTSRESGVRVPCLMYDHVYRLGIAWQNVGYNQPPHLGYYLPDATAARFTVENTRPITLHYNNCTGATLVKAVLTDGTEVPADQLFLTQDEKRCNLSLVSPTAIGTISHLVLQPVNASNGLGNTVTVTVNGEASTGICVTLEKAIETYANEAKLDFTTPISGLKAYVVEEVNDEGKAKLKEVTGPVPDGTGLILTGQAGRTYEIPQTTATVAAVTNKLVGVTTDTEIGGNDLDYILQDGRFVKAVAGTLKAGKAYLRLDAALARDVIELEGIATGIGETNAKRTASPIYNLNGQRISKPTKGLYITNGRIYKN